MSIARSLMFLPVAAAFGLSASYLRAADVVVQPASGSGFVIKDASGANERFRVQESGAISLPGVAAAPAQAQSLCMSASGQLGPCSGSGGGSYTAATGLSLTGTTFSVAPTYRLPQGCAANQIAQWNGSVWACSSAGGALPAGTVNQTLRYDASNALVANNLLQAFGDGGLVAGGAYGTGSIPATGAGTRFMWYPAKAALRAGGVNGTQWDVVSIGDYSVAMGLNSIAAGSGAIALGQNTLATNDGSVALGIHASATWTGATAMGMGTSAGDSGATAMGSDTVASYPFSTAMGVSAQATNSAATAMGNRTKASGENATAMGSSTTASGLDSVAMGSHTVADGDNSTAIGSLVNTNHHKGSFIYGDASRTIANGNSADNQFMVLADGGAIFYSNSTASAGVTLAHGGGSWTMISDRNAKTAVQLVNGREVLEKVVALPLNTWQYKAQESKYRHMGPMAQDFYAAFHLGETDKGIDTVDADGVALAAIQGLNVLLAEKETNVAERLDALQRDKNREMAALRDDMASRIKDKDAQIAALRAEKDREIAALRTELTTRVAALETLTGDLADVKAQLRALRGSASASVNVALQP